MAVVVVFVLGTLEKAHHGVGGRGEDDLHQGLEDEVGDDDRERRSGGMIPAKATATKITVSTSWPTRVEPMVRVHRKRPPVAIFILARRRIDEFAAEIAVRLARTIRGVSPRMAS
jgi:hypothetical protein